MRGIAYLFCLLFALLLGVIAEKHPEVVVEAIVKIKDVGVAAYQAATVEEEDLFPTEANPSPSTAAALPTDRHQQPSATTGMVPTFGQTYNSEQINGGIGAGTGYNYNY